MPDVVQRSIRALRALVAGPLFGDVQPPRPPPKAGRETVDARTAALRALKAYLTGCVFYLPMGEGREPEPFQVCPENFLIKASDGEHAQKYPSITVMGQPGKYEAASFVPLVDEDTRDQFGLGTVLVRHATYVEELALEVEASQEPEMRAVLAGLETAFNPTDGRSGLLLQTRGYFGVPARFLLVGRENYTETDSARNRRRAQVKVALDLNVVSLVRASPLQARAEVAVGFDPQTGLPLDLKDTPGAQFLVPPDAVDARLRRP